MLVLSKDEGVAKTIHGLFEAQVERTPTHIALITDEGTLSYQQLNQKANQLAHYLISYNLDAESIIAVSMPRSLDLVISFLAILKAGAAYLYLDPDYPEKRQEEIYSDVHPALVLSQLNWSDYQALPETNPYVSQSPNALAYIVYTSGSTGHPKGVMMAHEEIVEHLLWYLSTPIEIKKFLHLFPFSFDGGIAALWWPLLAGGTLVIPKCLEGLHESIIRFIDLEQISVLHLTPSFLQGLLAFPGRFDSVRDVVLAGEVFPVSLLTQLDLVFDPSRTRIWNFYGVSECAIVSCFHLVHRREQFNIPIGRPIPNTVCYVLSSDYQLQPPGNTGELYLGGKGLARAYLNQPEKTEVSFVTICLDGSYQRLYKTGDLAQWNAEGELEYLGRIDRPIEDEPEEKKAQDFDASMRMRFAHLPGWLQVEGMENLPSQGPLIIVTNTLHWWQILHLRHFLFKTLNVSDEKPFFLSANSLKMLHYLTLVHPIYLKRKASDEVLEAIEQLIQHLKNGKVLIMSEQGQNKNRLIAAKTGVAFLATQSQAPILPVAISYSRHTKRWMVRIGTLIKVAKRTVGQQALTKLKNKVEEALAKLLSDSEPRV